MNDKKTLNYINKEFIIMSTFVGLSKIWSQYGFHLSYMLDISTIYLNKSFKKPLMYSCDQYEVFTTLYSYIFTSNL